MNRFQLYKLFLIFFFLPPGQVYTQIKTLDPVINPSHFKIHHIGPEDGISSPISFLPSRINLAIYGRALNTGWIFIMVMNLRLKEYRDTDSTSYKLNWIYNLAMMRMVVYGSAPVTVCIIMTGTKMPLVTQYSHLDYPPMDFRCVVHGIWKDSQGLYWVFTQEGLFHFDRKKDLLTPTDVSVRNNWRAARNKI